MNKHEYQRLLNQLEKSHPDHILLPKLRKGLTLFNEKLISKAIDRINRPDKVRPAKKTAPTRQTTTTVQASLPRKATDPENVILKSYNAELNKLFTQRARLSNTFHMSAGAHEDMEIAESVIDIQNQIKNTMDEKNFYIKTKRLPEQESKKSETFEVPEDPDELKKVLKNVKSSLSHRKKELEKLHPEKDKERYTKKMATIERLTKHIIYLEQGKCTEADQ